MKSSALLLGAAGLLLLVGCDSGESAQEQGGEQGAQGVKEQTAAAPVEPAAEKPVAQVLSREFAGKAAPDLAFTTKDGADMRISDFAGRPVLVNLWATWCAPCKAEMPMLDRLSARLGEEAVVLPISQDMKGWEAITPFWDAAKLTALTPYLDADNAWLSAYPEAAALPTTILFDADGKEVWRVMGPADWAGEEVADLVLKEG